MGIFSKDSGQAVQPITSTQTTSSEPPAFQVPFLQKGLEAAEQNILNRPQQFFPRSTVTPFSTQTEAALGETERLARGGAPNIAAAEQLQAQNIAGDFLQQGNPFQQAAIRSAAAPAIEAYEQDVVPGIDATFSGSGRYGSGLHNIARQRAGRKLATDIAGLGTQFSADVYNRERARQEAAAAGAPQLYQAGFAPSQQLATVGAALEGLSEAELQDAIRRFNFAQQEPGIRAQEFGALAGLGGRLGAQQQSTTTTPVTRENPLLTGLGLTSLGAGAASSLFGQQGMFPGGWWS